MEGIMAAIGSWADIDAEKLKAVILQWREEGSRSATIDQQASA